MSYPNKAHLVGIRLRHPRSPRPRTSAPNYPTGRNCKHGNGRPRGPGGRDSGDGELGPRFLSERFGPRRLGRKKAVEKHASRDATGEERGVKTKQITYIRRHTTHALHRPQFRIVFPYFGPQRLSCTRAPGFPCHPGGTRPARCGTPSALTLSAVTLCCSRGPPCLAPIVLRRGERDVDQLCSC